MEDDHVSFLPLLVLWPALAPPRTNDTEKARQIFLLLAKICDFFLITKIVYFAYYYALSELV